MRGEDETWYDEEAGPLVRPYTVTSGRTRGQQNDLQMITLVVTLPAATGRAPRSLGPEHMEILSICQTPTSVAEISAELVLPLSVVKILLSDLIDRQLVACRTASAPDLQVLRAVIHGIRRL